MIWHFKYRSLAITETFIERLILALNTKQAFGYIFNQKERHLNLDHFANSFFSYFKSLIYTKEKPQIIHAHFGSNAILALPLSFRYKVPLVISFYGYDATGFLKKYPKLIYFVCKKARLILVLTEVMQNCLLDLGVRPDKVKVFNPGIPKISATKTTYSFQKPLKLLMASGLREKKNHFYVLDALKNLDHQSYILKIVGNGPLEVALKKKAKELGLNIEFFKGFFNDQERLAYFTWADLLLHPSKTAQNGDSEGLPFLILEAMQFGLSVVASHHAGMSTVFKDSCFYVDEYNPASLTDLLKNFNSQLALEKINLAKQLIDVKFDQNKNILRLNSLYKSISLLK